MSKERLEQFKDELGFLDDSADMEDYHRFVDTLKSLYEDGQLDWIYRYAKEQTEKVQELERQRDTELKQIDKLETHAQDLREALGRRQEQNKRYREAIEKALSELMKDKLFSTEITLSKALEDDSE